MFGNTVSIIGAGHCGCALAADLLSRKKSVMLYAHPLHSKNINIIRQCGFLKSTRMIPGVYRPKLSISMAELVRFSKMMIITVPAYGHDSIITELAQFDLREHIIICITGNFFSLAARLRINAKALIETSTSPYASRFEQGVIHILGIKQMLMIGSVPMALPSALCAAIEDIFSMPLTWCDNVLAIGLSCITGVIHPAPVLMNAGWIETTNGNFYFYREGISPAVGKVIAAIDRERQSIALGFGIKVGSVTDIMNQYYGYSFDSFAEFAGGSPEHNAIPMTPHSLQHRFIAQDVPYVLVPWLELGRKVGIECPTIAATIQLASLVNDINYVKYGRNLRSLGLAACSTAAILSICRGRSAWETVAPPDLPLFGQVE